MDTKSETKERRKPTEHSPSDKLSPNGISAISGNKESVQISDTKDADIHTAAVKAREKVPDHVASLSGKQVEYYKLRGRMGEELAVENIPESANLNDLTGKSNFANYDVTSPNEMSSIKTKGRLKDGSPRISDYNKYFRDLINSESKANHRAAEDLIDLSQESPKDWERTKAHLPPGVVNAVESNDPGKVAEEMVRKSTLRISGDQVAEVRQGIEKRIMDSPSDYGLDPISDKRSLQDQVHNLLRDRIRSIDKNFTTADIGKAARDIQDK